MRFARTFLICALLASCEEEAQPPEPPQAAAPPLVFEFMDADLGKVFQLDEIPLRYPFTVGDRPYTVHRLEPSCGCTSISLEVNGEEWPLGKEIPAGSRGAVMGEFHAELHVGVKNATVSAINDETHAADVLRLSAEVQVAWRLDEDMARFGRVSRGEAAEVTVRVTGPARFEILEWADKPDWIEVEDFVRNDPEGGPSKTRWVRFRLASSAPDGFLSWVAVASTSIDKPLTIPVRAAVVGPVVFEPGQRLNFGVVLKGLSPTKTLRITRTATGSDVPEPEAIIEGSEYYSLQVTRLPSDGLTKVDVTFSPDAPPGRHDAVLHVRYAGEYASESRDIDVSALVRD